MQLVTPAVNDVTDATKSRGCNEGITWQHFGVSRLAPAARVSLSFISQASVNSCVMPS